MRHYMRGNPLATVAMVRDEFERFFPSEHTGYVRLLRPQDVIPEELAYFSHGFFNASGKHIGSAEDEEDIRETAGNTGYFVYVPH